MSNQNNGVGLVLSGGGGKGAYQIGVLKVLKEKGLLNDVTAISGSSIGAVNSFLFAMDNVDVMYQAWDDIDMQTVFDIDLDLLKSPTPAFSRDEMLKLIEKYIDFDKIKNGRYEIYNAICKLSQDAGTLIPEYRNVNDYDVDMIKKILLASTSLPLIYEAVEIDGEYYRDGGICDNEPIKPLYDAGIRKFIVIGLKHGKILNTEKWTDAEFITIYPSHDLGNLFDGTLNFTDNAIRFREMLGEKDAWLAIKTKFEKDPNYIKMEAVLAKNALDEINIQLKTENAIKFTETKIQSKIDKINELAKKYENY